METVTQQKQTVIIPVSYTHLTFSDTYYDTSIVIYTRSSDKVSDYKQLKGKTVGVKNGTAAQTWLDKNASKYGFTVKTFDTSDLMNNSLDSGSVDAAMDDTPVVKMCIRDSHRAVDKLDTWR